MTCYTAGLTVDKLLTWSAATVSPRESLYRAPQRLLHSTTLNMTSLFSHDLDFGQCDSPQAQQVDSLLTLGTIAAVNWVGQAGIQAFYPPLGLPRCCSANSVVTKSTNYLLDTNRYRQCDTQKSDTLESVLRQGMPTDSWTEPDCKWSDDSLGLLASSNLHAPGSSSAHASLGQSPDTTCLTSDQNSQNASPEDLSPPSLIRERCGSQFLTVTANPEEEAFEEQWKLWVQVANCNGWNVIEFRSMLWIEFGDYRCGDCARARRRCYRNKWGGRCLWCQYRHHKVCSLVDSERGLAIHTLGRCRKCAGFDLPCETSIERGSTCRNCHIKKRKCVRPSTEYAPRMWAKNTPTTTSFGSDLPDTEYVPDEQWLVSLPKDGDMSEVAQKPHGHGPAMPTRDLRAKELTERRAYRMERKRKRLDQAGWTHVPGRVCQACANPSTVKSRQAHPSTYCLFLPDGRACKPCCQAGRRCVKSEGKRLT